METRILRELLTEEEARLLASNHSGVIYKLGEQWVRDTHQWRYYIPDRDPLDTWWEDVPIIIEDTRGG